MTASIMAYVPGSNVPGVSTELIVPDWTNNRMFNAAPAAVPAGISQWVGYVSGDLARSKTISQVGIVNVTADPICLCYNGNLVLPAGSGSNSVQLVQLRASDLTLVSTAFATSATITASNSTHLLSPGSIVPMRAGQTDLIITTPFALNQGEVCVLTIPGLGLINLGNVAETGTATLGPGKVSATVGTAYMLGRQNNRASLYKLSMTPFTSASLSAALATYLPGTIDATWTNFTSMNGCAYDSTDDTVILGFQTTDAVAIKSYIVKVHGSTGAIMWKCAVIYDGTRMDEAMRGSIIRNGRYYVFGDYQLGLGAVCSTINTATGTVTANPRISDMVTGAAGVSEDVSDSITLNAQWAEGTTHPNYIGTYMGTLGNHAYNGWLRFFPSGPSASWPPPPPVPQVPPVVSVNRAWSYVLDGHTFYVIDLSGQGTFVYDDTTNEWSNFATGTLPTNGSLAPQWNMQNGCMWGNRIVAGDLSTPNIWEMCPANTLDNDATQISHVVTGAVVARSRVFKSCEVVRVTASFGYMDSSGSVAFALRFSDNQGKTWSNSFTVTLAQADWSGEIAWRSLGSFCAPGRIFELSDVGGLIRIDGADIFLDNFDGIDAPPQGG